MCNIENYFYAKNFKAIKKLYVKYRSTLLKNRGGDSGNV
jgi:hypothetical protein